MYSFNNYSSQAHHTKHKNKSMDEKKVKNYQTEKYGFSRYNDDESEYSNPKICGIINLGNNCYLNSGLQIMASCIELVNELKEINISNRIIPYMKEAMLSLLSKKIYNPEKFINYFCSKNSDFIRGSQCCSQNFIRTLIRNMNSDCLSQNCGEIYKNDCYNPSNNEYLEYTKFLKSNKIYPESRIQNIFSGITKSFSHGKCKYCNNTIDNYSFSYFIDLNLYLDDIDEYNCSFADVLDSNIGNYNNLTMDCSGCGKEIHLKEITKFIKLPQVIIFTLERYQGETNNVDIRPNENINFNKYIDQNLKINCTDYELFAINIRYGKSANFGHEICQVKRNGNWYEINDKNSKKISGPSHNDCSYGLFYRKKNGSSWKSSIASAKPSSQNELEEGNDDIKINSQSKRLGEIDENKDSSCFGGNICQKPSENKNIKFNPINNFNKKYLNSGLHIISLFDELINDLKKYEITKNSLINLIKDITENIINNRKCDVYQLTQIKFKDKVTNSQNFIIQIIKSINDELISYKRIIKTNQLYASCITSKNEINDFQKFLKLYPESNAISFFSILTKFNRSGKCIFCKKENENYSFSYDVQKEVYIPDNSKYLVNFSEILEENFKKYKIRTRCSNARCKKEFEIVEEEKIIKLPEILIFTISRDRGTTKKTEIKPDEFIEMKKYIEPTLKEVHTKYQLFAINITTSNKQDCQIKRYGKWYEISEMDSKEINTPSFNDSISGLFYRKLKGNY